MLMQTASGRMRMSLRALGQSHTYDLARNGGLRAGLLLGLLVSAVEGILSGGFSLVLVAHPVLFGLLLGAAGTTRREIDRLHERDLAALSGLAMTDPLTGLYNRRYVEEELRNLLHRAERTRGPVSVVFFDLDHFKEVNQTLGHRGGDETLKNVAAALQSALRQGEILGRYGGDEFLLVVAADLPYAATCVERAVAAVKAATFLTLSAGVARYRDDGTTSEELIAAADARLEKDQAKHHAERSLALRRSPETELPPGAAWPAPCAAYPSESRLQNARSGEQAGPAGQLGGSL